MLKIKKLFFTFIFSLLSFTIILPAYADPSICPKIYNNDVLKRISVQRAEISANPNAKDLNAAIEELKVFPEQCKTDPLYLSQLGVFMTMRGKTTFFGLAKIAVTNEGLKLLDKALDYITTNPENYSNSLKALVIVNIANTFASVPESLFNKASSAYELTNHLNELITNNEYILVRSPKELVWLKNLRTTLFPSSNWDQKSKQITKQNSILIPPSLALSIMEVNAILLRKSKGKKIPEITSYPFGSSCKQIINQIKEISNEFINIKYKKDIFERNIEKLDNQVKYWKRYFQCKV